jgi:hypothetical protein
MKRQVMTLAWQVCSKFATFADALAYAWKVCKLRIALLLGVVRFEFRKVDGSIRKAVGTLAGVPETKGNGSAKGVFVFYDTEANGWRSAQVHSLIF